MIVDWIMSILNPDTVDVWTYAGRLFASTGLAAAIAAVIVLRIGRVLDARAVERLRTARAASQRRPTDPEMSDSGATVATEPAPEVVHGNADADSGGLAATETDGDRPLTGE